MALQTQQTADEILAHALASGRTITGAAQTAGVSESTAYRRLREPGFRTRVAELRAVLLDTINGQITTETVEACQTLRRLLISRSESTQLRAAKTVIELALKFNDRDRRAGLLGPDTFSPDTDETPAHVPAAGHEQPAAAPPPVVAARVDPRSDQLVPPREIVVPAGEVPAPGSSRDTRSGESLSVNLGIAAEASGQSAGNLSKPVTDCHRPAGGLPRQRRNGRPPLPPPAEIGSGKEGRPCPDQTDRLSAGLATALGRFGMA
ncbi:MAG: hypothetical protein JWO38_1418 [Gemmataceae bacterium]|nr:hypothetical protein [Gemmataceae bacterium]